MNRHERGIAPRRQWTARGVWCIEVEMDANLDRARTSRSWCARTARSDWRRD